MRELLFAGILFAAMPMFYLGVTMAASALLQPGRERNFAFRHPAAPAEREEAPALPAFRCKVISSRSVAPLLRELILSLPEGEHLDLRPGGWMEIVSPPFSLSFTEYVLPAEHRSVWDRMGIWGLAVSSRIGQIRPYWLSNTPEDGRDWIVLLVRLALPPPVSPGVLPGIVSSWAFNLRAGDEVEVRGPIGGLDLDREGSELVLIAAGEGMAPVRSILSDLLTARGSKRPIRFWYGGRSAGDLAYAEELDRLAQIHANFEWHAVLAEPAGEEDEGALLHDGELRIWLSMHAAPEECEFLLYGPQLLARSVLAMLDDLGIRQDRIRVNGELPQEDALR